MDRLHRTREARCQGDDGLAMALMGIFMVVLLAFVGFAVDVGMLYNERRQEQSAADTAALAAVQDMTWNEQVDTVFDIVNASGDTQYTEADWNDAANCPTADIPAGFTTAAQTATTRPSGVSLNTQCIASDGTIGNSDYKVWVRVPTTSLTTVFAGLVGVNTMNSSAFAIAGMGAAVNDNRNIMPFAITNMPNGDGSATCLLQPPGGLANDFCPGPSQGNFGAQLMYRNTQSMCGNNTINETIRNNVAMGLDHKLQVFDPAGVPFPANNVHPDATVDACATASAPPDALDVDTGGNASLTAIPNGLFSAPGAIASINDGLGGRLRRYPTTSPAWPTFDFVSPSGTWAALDNKPLWQFIGPSAAGRSFGGDWVTPLAINYGVPIGPPTSAIVPAASNAAIHSWNLAGNSLPGICDPGVASYVEPHRNDDNNAATPIDNDNPAGGVLDVPRTWPWNYSRMVHCLYALDHATVPSPAILLNLKTIDSTPLPGGKYDIEYSPRFAWVPESWRNMQTYPSGGSDQWEIKRFRAVFLNDTMYSTGAGRHCYFRVGEGRIRIPAAGNPNPCANGSQFRSINSIMLDTVDPASASGPTMLPVEVQDRAPAEESKPQPSLIR